MLRVRVGAVMIVLAALLLCGQAHAATIAYWRFENAIGDKYGHETTNAGVTFKSTGADPLSGNFWDVVPIYGIDNDYAGEFSGAKYAYAKDDDDWTQADGFTIEAFVRPTTLSDSFSNVIVSQWHTIWGYSWQFGIDTSGHPYLKLYDGTEKIAIYDTYTLSEDTSYALAAAFDGDDVFLYAKEYGQGVYSESGKQVLGVGTLANSNDSLNLGTDTDGDNYFTGYIDEVRLSSGVLSESELLASPEPASGIALLAGLAGAFVAWRKRRSAPKDES